MLAGLLMMARTVDKARALLIGGNPGRYYITPGISAWILNILTLTEGQFLEIVRSAKDDAEVEARLATFVTGERRQQINGFVARFTLKDVGEQMRARFEADHPGLSDENTPIIDLLESDDRTFVR